MPERPTHGGTALPLVSLTTGPDFLIESKGTVSAHVFNVTRGPLPEGGLTVSVNAPKLSEFDLDEIEVIDGEITAVREDGFDFKITNLTAIINLPVAKDGEAEGLKSATFTLKPGEGYEVNSELGSGSFNLVDTADEVPISTLSEPNEIIPVAIETGLSSENPSFAVTSSIDFEFGNRYENEDGSFKYVDFTEDVDLYSFELSAGNTVTIDVDAGQFDTAIDPSLRLFDAEGMELAVSDDNSAPDEIFNSVVDPYLEFTAKEDGIYYAGVSHWENLKYDPFTSGSGDGTVYSILGGAPYGIVGRGEYGLNINLVSETGDGSGSDSGNINLVSEAGNGSGSDDGGSTGSVGPTVSLQTITGAFDGEDNLLAPAIVKSLEDGSSVLTLVLGSEGSLPEEGLEVTINSDIAGSLTDYFDVGFGSKPFSPGGEVLEAVYNPETGEATGIRFRLNQPYAVINLPVLEGEEADGPQQVSLFLEPDEGYTVNPDASASTITFYDIIEQVPEPTVVPEVSFEVSNTTLVESEGSLTTLNFSLSEPPPEEGVLVYVNSGTSDAIGEFVIFAAEIAGGVFPSANFSSSGFYFKILEQTASITLPAFPNEVVEGIEKYTYTLKPSLGYTVNPEASSGTITIADTPNSQIQVSLTVEPSILVESEGTISVHNFSLSASPPEDGVTVFVSATSLGEFDFDAIEITGGTITEVTEEGFFFKITEQEAVINLPVAKDGQVKGLEESTFTLEPGNGYQVNPDASSGTFNLVDTPEQAPPPPIATEPNDTISDAFATNLSLDNPVFSIGGAIFNDADSELDNFRTRDPSEDVDFYSFELEGGQTVTIDVDSIEYESEKFEEPQRLDSELRLFDAEGTELLQVNNASAAGEEVGRDPYLKFTAEAAGTYYVGLSQLGNRDYEPFTEGSGSGWIFPELGINSGSYELEINLEAGDGTGEPVEFVGGDGNDALKGFGGDDTIAGGLGNDEIFGNGGDDVLRGDLNSRSPGGTVGGNDTIYGGAGSDRIGGKAGNDTLYGDSGDDRIWGDAGNDLIYGGRGNDTLRGGAPSVGSASRDTFVLATGEGTDTILDFQVGEDLIGLAESLTFGQLSITQDGNNAVINFEDETLAIVNRVGATTLTSNLFTPIV